MADRGTAVRSGENGHCPLAPSAAFPEATLPAPTKTPARALAIAALFVVITVALLWPAVLHGQLPVSAGEAGDLRSLYPVQHQLVERLRAGEGAEWLHDVGFGVPGARWAGWALWSPFTLPAWVLPFPAAWAVGAAARLVVAMAGAFLLARALSIPTGAAVLAGVLYGAADALVGELGTTVSHGAAVLPLLLWATQRTLEPGAAWWRGGPLALAAAALWLAGSLPVAVAGTLATLPLVAARLLSRRRTTPVPRGVVRSVTATIAGTSIGVGLASFVVLPSLGLLRERGTLETVLHRDGLRPIAGLGVALLLAALSSAFAALIRRRADRRGVSWPALLAATLLAGAALLPVGGLPLRWTPRAIAHAPQDALFRPPAAAAELARVSIRHRVGITDPRLLPHAYLEHGIAGVGPDAFAAGGRLPDLAGQRWLGMVGVGRVAEAGGAVSGVGAALPVVSAPAVGIAVPSGSAPAQMARLGVQGLRRAAVVEPLDGRALPAMPDGDVPAELVSWQRAGGVVRARVSSRDGAVLVALDEALHGWRARVDGRPATPVRVNHAFVGVVLPPGVHHVELRYIPPFAATSALASVRSLGALFGWLLLRWLHERTGMSTRQLVGAATLEAAERWESRRGGRAPSRREPVRPRR